MNICRVCKETLPDSEFSDWGRRRLECRACTSRRNRNYSQANKAGRNQRLREWRRRNPEEARQKDLRARLKRKYNLTPEEVEQMRDLQGGRCLLCDTTTRELVVDHHHDTGRVRGLLCRNCNTIVGQVELAPVILERISGYLGHGTTNPGLASSKSTSA